MKNEDDSGQSSPALRCWFCDASFAVGTVLRDGILRSRDERHGGPYRLLVCPSCSKENICECTEQGRWFASPNCRISFLDYLFSQFLDTSSSAAETLLAAISWLRENEERRRYFFERDGDRRYRQGSWLRGLWPTGRPDDPARKAEARRPRPEARAGARCGPGERRQRQGGRSGRPQSEGARREGEDADEFRTPRPRPRIVTPHEILGIPAHASATEVRDAFRRLALHYHPDKVMHLGEEFERAAHEKFLRLKDAYETLIARDRERG